MAKFELGKGRGMRPEELHSFLTETKIFAKVATTNADGWPYVNPVWYDYDDGAFYIVTKELAGLTQNLRRDPRCSILIDNPEPPYKRVLVMGEARFVEEDWVGRGRRLVLRYLGEAGLDYFEATLNLPRVTIRVDPIKLTSWNGGGVDRTFHEPTRWHDVAQGDQLEHSVQP
jgi:PPOX class probable F420-dependent enzyme